MILSSSRMQRGRLSIAPTQRYSLRTRIQYKARRTICFVLLEEYQLHPPADLAGTGLHL